VNGRGGSKGFAVEEEYEAVGGVAEEEEEVGVANDVRGEEVGESTD
jgi:hypothetical protein